MMEFRRIELQRALDGLTQTGVPLVSQIGDTLAPAGATDDPGFYLIVPYIAHWLGIPVLKAAEFFLALASVSSGLVALVAIGYLIRPWRFRIAAWVLLFWYFHRMRALDLDDDVYLFNSITPIALVPLLFHAVRFSSDRLVLAAFAASGVLAGISNLIRSHSGTAVLIFAATVIVLTNRSKTWKAGALGIVLVGAVLAPLAMKGLVLHRDAYLASHVASYEPREVGHPFWHSIYIGLGFVQNPYGIQYRDEVADQKVRSISPGARYLSEEYETILRQAVLSLVVKDPYFVVRSLLGKARATARIFVDSVPTILLAIMLCSLATAPLGRQPFLVWSLLAGGLFSALPGVLVWPWISYMNGAIAFALLYVLYLLAEWSDRERRPRPPEQAVPIQDGP